MTAPIANTAMAEAWEGESEHWVAHERHYDRSAARHQTALFAVACIPRDGAVLDVGCGTGGSTRAAARLAADGGATGLDIAPPMIDAARRVAEQEGLDNVRFEVADAQVHDLVPDAYDVVMSRFGAMFFGDPVAAFANLRSATTAGGRLALLTWQALDQNEWQVRIRAAIAAGRELPAPPVGAPGPFGLADPERTRSLLDDAGWRDVTIEAFEAPIWLGADPDEAFAFVQGTGFVRGALTDLDPDARQAALDRLHTTLAAATTHEGVQLPSRAWLVDARR